MSSLVQQGRKELDKVHLQNILEDDSLTFAEKAISIKSVQTKGDGKDGKAEVTALAGDIVVVISTAATGQAIKKAHSLPGSCMELQETELV